jgi:T5SS/PEP-CTERM-associated repeat protein
MTVRRQNTVRFAVGLISLLHFAMSCRPANPSNFFWRAGQDGSFNDPAKWSPSGVPGNADAAVFRVGEGEMYTVGFPGNPPFVPPAEYSTERLRVGSNAVTFIRASSPFAQGPVSYTVLNSTIDEAGRGIIIGELATDVAAVLNLAPSLPLTGVAATLGDAAGASGTLNIDGSALNLTVFGNNVRPLIVGNHGNGVLNVNNGADVNLSGTSELAAVLGNYSGSSGTLSISGAGSMWNNSGELFVGNSGEGMLTINAAASVSNTRTRLGVNPGSTGSVAVTGAGSTLNNSFEMVVGNSGTLTIDNGGDVSDTGGYIGFNSGSNGQVTIDGPGSTWTNSGSLHVGYLGSGTLTVQHGGAV